MFVLALYAAIAYAPDTSLGGAAVLTLVLTAVVVYPVILFGALFVLIALSAVATSLTVEIGHAGITTVRRLFGVRYSHKSVPIETIVALEREPIRAPRGLGGAIHYRLSVKQAGGAKLTVGEPLPDESLCRSLQELIETHMSAARGGL